MSQRNQARTRAMHPAIKKVEFIAEPTAPKAKKKAAKKKATKK